MSFAYKHADAITCLSSGCRQAVVDQGADRTSTVTMLNWAPRVEPTQNEVERAIELVGDWADQGFVSYAGALGPLQGVDRMCDAARQTGARLVVVGDGREADALHNHAKRTDTPARFVGQQPPGVANAIVSMSAATIVYLETSALDSSAIPSKLAASVMAGIPVVVAASGETRNLAQRIDAGPSCGPGDTTALANCLSAAIGANQHERSKWAENASSFAETWVSPELGIDRYARFLRTVAKKDAIQDLVDDEWTLV